jgi:hypothetical protein
VYHHRLITDGMLTLGRLDTGPKDDKSLPITIQLGGYLHADQALTRAAAIVNSIINSNKAQVR